MNALNLEFVLLIFKLHLFGCQLSDTDSMLSMEGRGWQWQAGRVVDRGVNCNGQDVINGLAGVLGFLGPNANCFCFGLRCHQGMEINWHRLILLLLMYSYSRCVLVRLG